MTIHGKNVGALEPGEVAAIDVEFHRKHPKSKHGTSKHRGARVQKFSAAQKKKKSKRKKR